MSWSELLGGTLQQYLKLAVVCGKVPISRCENSKPLICKKLEPLAPFWLPS